MHSQLTQLPQLQHELQQAREQQQQLEKDRAVQIQVRHVNPNANPWTIDVQRFANIKRPHLTLLHLVHNASCPLTMIFLPLANRTCPSAPWPQPECNDCVNTGQAYP
jgi:hypothetical protein